MFSPTSICPQTWPHSSRPLSSKWCSLLTMLIAKFISAESCLHLQPVSVFRRLSKKRIPWCKSLRSKSFGMLCWLPQLSSANTHTSQPNGALLSTCQKLLLIHCSPDLAELKSNVETRQWNRAESIQRSQITLTFFPQHKIIKSLLRYTTLWLRKNIDVLN